jgi:hypothetical protein
MYSDCKATMLLYILEERSDHNIIKFMGAIQTCLTPENHTAKMSKFNHVLFPTSQVTFDVVVKGMCSLQKYPVGDIAECTH